MSPRALDLAAAVLAKADAQHPADQVLRDTLRVARPFAPKEHSQVAHAVFSFYRWRGWLDQRGPLHRQLSEALHLADRFERGPKSFTDQDLEAHAVPRWVYDQLRASGAWARELQAEPHLWLRAKRGQGAAVAESLGDCRLFGQGAFHDTLEYVGERDLFRTPEFHAGMFEVHDLSSQAVGLICAPQPGETWWDACAGEGGKTLHLSDLMQNRGLIWATDRTGWRLDKLKRRAARAQVFNYRTATWLKLNRLPTRTRFDGILVDAPCSGIGTWQRNPHARWTTRPEDVVELATLQLALLKAVASSLKPGGRLIYSVCTLSRTETTGVADGFEALFPQFQPWLVPSPFSDGSPPSARFRFWPQDHGGNGMFVAVYKNVARAAALE